MIKETLNLRGDLSITKRNVETGASESYEFRNLVVDDGIEFMLRSMIDDSRPEGIKAMALGTGATAQVSTDAALQSEIVRVSLDSKILSGINNTMTFQATFDPGEGTGAITEAGMFNNSTQGGAPEDTMLCRTVFATINKDAADQLIISWVITLALAA